MRLNLTWSDIDFKNTSRMIQDVPFVHVASLHHRRRREGSLETEVQADFAFLTTRGELEDEESEGTIKILVLTELATSCIGYVVVTSARKVKSQICK